MWYRMYRYIVNIILAILPSSKFFIFKRKLIITLLKYDISENVSLNSGISFYGDSKVSNR